MKAATKILTLVILFIGFSNSIYAKNKKITVTVKDQSTEQPVLYAQVTVITLQNGKEIETVSENTGAKGRCKLSIRVDDTFQYIIRASKIGYIPCQVKDGNRYKDKDKVSEILVTTIIEKDFVLYITPEVPQETSQSKNEVEVGPQVIDTTLENQTEPEAKTRSKSKTKAVTNEQDISKKNAPEYSPSAINDQEVDDPIEKPSNTNDKGTDYAWLWILGIVLGIFLWITYKRYDRKCDRCKKWNSMRKKDEKLIDQKPSKIKKTIRTKHANGKYTEKEVYVPATTYTYNIYRECKHCGYEDTVKKVVKKAN